MRNFQDTFYAFKRAFIHSSAIDVVVGLRNPFKMYGNN